MLGKKNRNEEKTQSFFRLRKISSESQTFRMKLPDNGNLSSRSRYDHFDTSPYYVLCLPEYNNTILPQGQEYMKKKPHLRY